jgi:3-hydroxyisobutyrate dehydrogenase-like beta-hydroxyacid dehydrogenase
MRVALLGLGHMGAPIAERLERSGHELSVWNRSPGAVEPFVDRGIRALDQPAQAWEHADVAITMLSDGAALENVVIGRSGLLEGAGAGAGLVIDMSTISNRTSAHVAAECERHGGALLAAPVTGNPSVVVAGNLGIIVSGPRREFERVREMLADIGPNVMYVGESHEARIVKLALNLMLGGTTQLLAEALVLGEKHGIARSAMLEVIGGSAIASPFVKYKTDALNADDYSSTFTARLLYKDLALALQAAHDRELPLPLTASTQQLVEGCIASGMGDLDMTALLPRLRREAGL